MSTGSVGSKGSACGLDVGMPLEETSGGYRANKGPYRGCMGVPCLGVLPSTE